MIGWKTVYDVVRGKKAVYKTACAVQFIFLCDQWGQQLSTEDHFPRMVEEDTGVESMEEPANGTRKGTLKAGGCDGCFLCQHDWGAQTSGRTIF